MKIAVIQVSSQKIKNDVLFECTKHAVQNTCHEVINFGVFFWETAEYTYIQTAFLISCLLESQSVDFVVTGCSSGQGMMLACNSLPGVLCGYAPTPADAALFGRINHGNALSLPLGLQYGWAGELNLQYTLNALWESPFGAGYPPSDAERKQKDTKLLKEINAVSKLPLKELAAKYPKGFIKSCLARQNVYAYILQYGKKKEIIDLLRHERIDKEELE